MNLELLDIVNIIVIFQLLIFSFFLFTKKKNTISNRILGLFLFSQSVGIFHFLTINNPSVISALSPHLYLLGLPFQLVWGPTFYLYIKSLMITDYRLPKDKIIHFIPFIITVLYLLFNFYFLDSWTKISIIRAGTVFSPIGWTIYSWFQLGQITSYCIIAFIALVIYQKNIKESYSSLKGTDISWLKFIVYGYCFAHAVSASYAFIIRFAPYYAHLWEAVVFFTFFIFFNIIFYYAWTRPEVFTAGEDTKKYKSSTLTQNEAQSFSDMLTAYMMDEKPYLKPDLSLNEVADAIQVHQRYVSQIINERFNQNFFDFINSYRLEESKRMLANKSLANKTVLEILYESGFNTKSAFYVAFKKNTGLAPNKFREIHMRVN
jgi:AraC-like DNA-binding protein